MYRINLGNEWLRWHGAAVLRLGKTFPPLTLSRVRDAYRALDAAPEHRLLQLLQTVPWRLQRLRVQQEIAERQAAKRATLAAKNEQRRRQNELDAAVRKKKTSGGNGGRKSNNNSGAGMGWQGDPGKAQWRQRKLKPPGTLDKKF